MKRVKSLCVWSIAAASVLLSTGCIDAFGRGLADGIIDGLAGVVETVISDAFAGASGGGE